MSDNNFESQFDNTNVFEGGTLGSSANQREIINSSVYQEAKELFSKEENKQWLTRLQAIVSSAQTYTAQNPFSQLFNKQQIADKNKEVISNALLQIQQLIAEYQQYRNSLPSTQAQQYSDAGLNPLSQSYSGSSITPNVSAQSAGVPETTPLNTIIESLIGSVLSISNGIMSFVSSGIEMSNKIKSNELDNIKNFSDLIGKGFVLNPNLFPKKYRKFIENIQTSEVNEAALSGKILETRKNLFENLYIEGFSNFFDETDISDIMKDLARLKITSIKADYRNNILSKNKDSEYLESSDPNIRAISENQKNAYNANYFKYRDPLAQVDSENTSDELNIERNRNNKALESEFSDMLKSWQQKSNDGNILYSWLLLNMRNSGTTGLSDVVNMVGKLL